jgi:hypothetical protein
MASGDAGAAVDDRSIARDSLGEALCAVARGAALGQKLDATSISDAVRGLNLIPELAPMLAKIARG